MRVIDTKFNGLKIIQQKKHGDTRGHLRETYIKKIIRWNDLIFDYATTSKKNVLRGFHFQSKFKQAKFVTVIKGKILDYVLDLRKKSKTYKQWSSLEIDSNKRQSIYVPAGCANAFLTLEDNTIVHYYMNDLYNPNTYKGIRYNDPSFSFKWPFEPKVISEKDLNLPDFIDG